MPRPAPRCHRRASPASRAPARGFTLIEMVVVMVIIAAMAVLGVMAMTGGFERMRLQSSSKQIVANLRYARTQAIATGEPKRFIVDPRAHAWQGPNGRAGSIPESLGVRFTGAREVMDRPGVGAIVFFADGASTGGRVQISSGTAAANIDVTWLTGEVTLHRGTAER